MGTQVPNLSVVLGGGKLSVSWGQEKALNPVGGIQATKSGGKVLHLALKYGLHGLHRGHKEQVPQEPL